MSKIEKINLNKTIDYSDENIEYFIKKNTESKLLDYQEIVDKIKGAKNSIKIASISNISNEILDALHNNLEINIYMIFKSFDNSTETLSRFDKRKPIIAREVQELENSFIIIDNISYLFINPLSQKENIYILVDEKETQDLGFIFNYYFWNCASMEKLVENISKPMESPFPPFGKRELNFINIRNLESCKSLYIPRDKKYINQLDMNANKKYFSDDLKRPILINNDNFQIGNFVLNLNFEIKNSWLLQSNTQREIDISLDIIPKVENWDKTINILDFKEIELSDIRASTIEEMGNVKPDSFPKESYVNSIKFYWNVLPPIKLQTSKKSSLYGQFDKLKNDLNRELDVLEITLNNLKKESNLLSKWFMGTTRQTDRNLKKITEYRNINLHLMSIFDLENFFNKEFKNFYNGIIKSEKDFKEDKKRKEAEEQWNRKKEQKEKFLEKRQSEKKDDETQLSNLKLKSEEKKILQTKIDKFTDEIRDLGKEKQANQFKLNNISKIEKEIESIQDEIETLKKKKEELKNEQKE